MSSQQPLKIVVVGATGNVGRKIVELLLQKNLVNPEQMLLLASKNSDGNKLQIGDHTFTVKSADDFNFAAETIYLFATESDISKKYIEKISAPRAVVIDSSSLLRLEPRVPLIVAPVNSEQISIKQSRRYAIANCIASPVALALAPIHKAYKIHSAHITTYQSVSGAGKNAMDELYWETKNVSEGTQYQRKEFLRQIAFNVIPQIGKLLQDGYTQEEFKIAKEIQKILGADFPICATSVRVPVFVGHSSSVVLNLENKFELKDITELLQKSPGVICNNLDFTTPTEAAGKDEVYVGRIRRDPTTANGLCLWLCSDNLRRGAAVDAVEVAEEVIRQLTKD